MNAKTRRWLRRSDKRAEYRIRARKERAAAKKRTAVAAKPRITGGRANDRNTFSLVTRIRKAMQRVSRRRNRR